MGLPDITIDRSSSQFLHLESGAGLRWSSGIHSIAGSPIIQSGLQKTSQCLLWVTFTAVEVVVGAIAEWTTARGYYGFDVGCEVVNGARQQLCLDRRGARFCVQDVPSCSVGLPGPE